MPFLISNLIMLTFGCFTYFYFRCGVYSYFKKTKMSKNFICKNMKGKSNYWFYSQLHKQNNLGVIYYLNIIYLLLLTVFTITFLFSWLSFLKIPVIILGLLLGVASVPVYLTALIYINIEDTGKPFVFFRTVKGYNRKSRRFTSLFDWIFGFIPIALYIFFLTV